VKKCSYCGAEYSDATAECSIDHEPLVPDAPAPSQHTKEQKDLEHIIEIRPLTPTEKQNEWLTIVTPHDNFEANIVMGRLRSSGIEARLHASVIGGWLGKQIQTFVQVRPKDYDAAKDLLSATP